MEEGEVSGRMAGSDRCPRDGSPSGGESGHVGSDAGSGENGWGVHRGHDADARPICLGGGTTVFPGAVREPSITLAVAGPLPLKLPLKRGLPGLASAPSEGGACSFAARSMPPVGDAHNHALQQWLMHPPQSILIYITIPKVKSSPSSVHTAVW